MNNKTINRGWLLALFVLLAATARSQGFSQDGLYYKVLSADDKTCELTQRPTGSEDECGSDVTIPATVTSNGVSYSVIAIGSGSFDNCAISKITIPSSIGRLDDDALAVKNYIPRIYINRTTPPITSDYAFTNASLTKGNVTAYVPKGCLSNYQSHSIWRRFNLVENVEKVDTVYASNMLFASTGPYSCALIEKYNSNCVFIPKAVPIKGTLHTVSSFKFKGNRSLSSKLLVLPDNIYKLDSLNSLYTMQEVGGRDIYNLVLPRSLTEVGTILVNTMSLQQIFMQTAVPPFSFGDDTFTGNVSCSTILNVPKGSLEAYKNAPGWKNFVRIREKEFLSPPDEQFSEGNLNFIVYSEADKTCEVTGYNSDSITGHVDVPSHVQHNGTTYKVVSIGPKAFYETELSSITFPNTLRHIATQAFRDCKRLQYVIIPDSVTSIGGQAFYSCDSLRTIVLGECVNKIGSGAFASYIGEYRSACLCYLRKLYVKNPVPPTMVGIAYEPTLWGRSVEFMVYHLNVSHITIYVPKGASSTYANDEQWGEYKYFTPIEETDFSDIDLYPDTQLPTDY